MGEQTLAFVNGLAFPLAQKLEPRLAALQRFTATIEALYCPDIDASLDGGREDGVLEGVQAGRAVVGRATALLRVVGWRWQLRFLALLGLYFSVSELLPNLPSWGDVLWVDFALSALIFRPGLLRARAEEPAQRRRSHDPRHRH